MSDVSRRSIARRLSSPKPGMRNTVSTMYIPRNNTVRNSARNDAEPDGELSSSDVGRSAFAVRSMSRAHAFEDCDGKLRQTQADLLEPVDLECVLDLVGPARMDSDHNSTFGVSESRSRSAFVRIRRNPSSPVIFPVNRPVRSLLTGGWRSLSPFWRVRKIVLPVHDKEVWHPGVGVGKVRRQQ